MGEAELGLAHPSRGSSRPCTPLLHGCSPVCPLHTRLHGHSLAHPSHGFSWPCTPPCTATASRTPHTPLARLFLALHTPLHGYSAACSLHNPLNASSRPVTPPCTPPCTLAYPLHMHTPSHTSCTPHHLHTSRTPLAPLHTSCAPPCTPPCTLAHPCTPLTHIHTPCTLRHPLANPSHICSPLAHLPLCSPSHACTFHTPCTLTHPLAHSHTPCTPIAHPSSPPAPRHRARPRGRAGCEGGGLGVVWGGGGAFAHACAPPGTCTRARGSCEAPAGGQLLSGMGGDTHTGGVTPGKGGGGAVRVRSVVGLGWG